MKNKWGFTLIELLVVIAIIALLLAIIVPALRTVKRKASSILCMTNVKNLSLAWYSYQEANKARIMSAHYDAVELDGTRVGWMQRPQDINGNLKTYDQLTPPVTDDDEKRGIEKGRLYPYLESFDVFHCPGDTLRVSVYDQTKVFVSYSVPMCLHGYALPSNAYYNKQINKFNEITSPGTRYVFVESAEERNFQMYGWFGIATPPYSEDFTRTGWWSPMAVNHADSSTLGYADGHATLVKWQDSYTKWRVNKLHETHAKLYTAEYPGSCSEFPATMTHDVDFMGQGWPYRPKK